MIGPAWLGRLRVRAAVAGLVWYLTSPRGWWRGAAVVALWHAAFPRRRVRERAWGIAVRELGAESPPPTA